MNPYLFFLFKSEEVAVLRSCDINIYSLRNQLSHVYSLITVHLNPSLGPRFSDSVSMKIWLEIFVNVIANKKHSCLSGGASGSQLENENGAGTGSGARRVKNFLKMISTQSSTK